MDALSIIVRTSADWIDIVSLVGMMGSKGRSVRIASLEWRVLRLTPLEFI